MRTWSIAALLVLFGLESPAATKPESFTVNGLKVIFVTNPATEIIASNMYFRGGVAVAGMERAGIERLALLAATRATKNYPRDKMSAALERMNTLLGSTAGPDYSSITMQCVKQNFGESWKIFSDVILQPTFDSAVVERERERTLAGIKQVKDSPDAYLTQLGVQTFYRENPYAIDPAGTERTVRSFSRRDLQAYLQGRVNAAQMLLVVCGNITRAELEPMVKASFGALPQGSFTMTDPLPVRHAAPSVTLVKRELPTTYITGLFPAPPFGTPEGYAMTIARSVLGDRLFEEVRTKRSLSYAPGAIAGQMFSNYAGIYVTAVQPETTIAVMVGELRKLRDEPLPLKTLDDKKNLFFTGYYLSIETNAGQADMLARYELSGKGYQEGTRLMENIRRVTAEDIQKVAKEYIQNLQFVLIGNPPSLQLTPFMF